MSRTPAVAGQFYDASPQRLLESVEACFVSPLGPGKLPQTRENRLGRLLGLVCPHAGLVYSGSAAAWAYQALAHDGIPDVAVILGPNHYGLGPAVAISPDESWQTPLGAVNCDAVVRDRIIGISQFVQSDRTAHSREHSIEVQLPFLRYICGDRTKIVPISIAHLSRTDALTLSKDLGAAIAEAISGLSAVVIASSDLTHYESKSAAAEKDGRIMERLTTLDPEGLIELVYERDLTMCGAIGTAVMLEGCKHLGATSANVLTYYSSGEVTGDTDQVVGYGAVSVEK